VGLLGKDDHDKSEKNADLFILVGAPPGPPRRPTTRTEQMWGPLQAGRNQGLRSSHHICATILGTAARASAIFSGWLPPAWAMSGRPPPLPPTSRATCLTISPAR